MSRRHRQRRPGGGAATAASEEAAMDFVVLQRDVVDLQQQINLLSKRRKAVGATSSKDAMFQRVSADLRSRIKLLIQRSYEIDAKLGAIPAATKNPFKFESSPPVVCCWEDDFTTDDSDCDGGPPGDSLDATSDIYGLFTNGPEAYIPPSSGNPIYDDYADDEIDFSHSLSDPIFDDYGDDEVDVVDLTTTFGEPIYDAFDDIEEVVDEYVTEHVGPVLLPQAISCTPQTLVSEQLHSELKFCADSYLDPYDVTCLAKATDVIVSDPALVRFSIGATYEAGCYGVDHVAICDFLLGCVNWESQKKSKHVLLDFELIFFSPMLRRYFLFVWKPGWVGFFADSAQIRGRIFSALGRMMRANNNWAFGLK